MPVVDPRIAGKPVPRISKERMEREYVARVKNVEALDVAFLEQRFRANRKLCYQMVHRAASACHGTKLPQLAYFEFTPPPDGKTGRHDEYKTQMESLSLALNSTATQNTVSHVLPTGSVNMGGAPTYAKFLPNLALHPQIVNQRPNNKRAHNGRVVVGAPPISVVPTETVFGHSARESVLGKFVEDPHVFNATVRR